MDEGVGGRQPQGKAKLMQSKGWSTEVGPCCLSPKALPRLFFTCRSSQASTLRWRWSRLCTMS